VYPYSALDWWIQRLRIHGAILFVAKYGRTKASRIYNRSIRGYNAHTVSSEVTVEVLVLGHPGSGGQRPTMSAHYVAIGERNINWSEDATIAASSDAPIEQVDLLACVRALELLRHREIAPSVSRIVVKIQSSYLLHNVGRALFDWPRRKWVERDGSPVPHASQWKRLLLEMSRSARRVEFKKAAP